MDECDYAVVGGGILGLAVARELSGRRPDARVTVFEREPEVGTHQTGHNSGVIHAGIYYAPGSLKARLCVEGAAELYELCERHGVPHELLEAGARLPAELLLGLRVIADQVLDLSRAQVAGIHPHVRLELPQARRVQPPQTLDAVGAPAALELV